MKWEHPASAHPERLGIEDFEAIARSPALFARKFDSEIDAGILDKIDGQLLFTNRKA